ncbi:MAG: type VI secretion system tip protein VgrG, partial [Planctomycetes bacterium]|nr:type VI secretion system tip protein VgrG [Planctomycetota bacterium]
MSEASLRAEVTLEGYEDSILQMVSFEVTEALSTLYALEVTVLTPTLVEPESVLGKKAAVMLTNDTDAPPRSFHGVVFEASLSAVDGDAERFELRFVARPRMARLELGQNARITQDMNVPDAIGLVLEESGVAAEHFEWATTGTYEEHPYITQFEESDYGYAARLLAREGISYLVENDFDEERVIFFDDDTVFQPCEHSDALSFLDTVLAMSDTLTSTSDKVALRDYDFTKPATDLTVGADGEETTGREVYLHPGDFLETSRGDRLARVTLERLQRDRRLFHGESVWHYLAPGRTFACVDHPRAELSAEMVVVRVRHVWAQRGYLNEFSCIPRETPFQAVAQPAGPVVGGTQVAFVTGPSGAELHGSERGQVKVRFPWDRSGITDDTSSTWLRVGQFALPGSMVVPRVGFEVLVDFEMASNDRPLVAGHLYNGEAMPPYELPAGAATSSIQTNTTEGGGGANELRFGDTAGSEELFMNASYDQTTSVENDSKTSINANETVSIGADNSVKVTGSYNLDVKGARSLSVGGNQAVSTSANYGDGTSGSL